jgi:HlyD family secretion protein
MRTKVRWIIFAAFAAGIVLLAAFSLTRNSQAQHFTATVERGNIDDVVEAAGTINPIVTVLVGSQVSGTIAKLNADFNSYVHKGDVVALIDPALFEGALLEAKSDLEDAKANLVAARANLMKLKATLVQTKADYERAEGLLKGGVQSQQQLDLAKANYDSANAAVNAAAANVTQAEAQVAQKEAAVKVAQTNLDYTVIRSPIDGTVVAPWLPPSPPRQSSPSPKTSRSCGCTQRQTNQTWATSKSEKRSRLRWMPFRKRLFKE